MALFEQGETLLRRDVHARFGGQRQGGISTPAEQPLIFLVTGESGSAFGYSDGWDDGTFCYSGEGQVGDMEFKAGNLAVRDHAETGRELHLFEKVRPAHWRYIGQMVCAGYDLVPNTADRNGNPRVAIVFRLTPVPMDDERGEMAVDTEATTGENAERLWKADLATLRQAATEGAGEGGVPPHEAKRRVYQRSAALRVYVMRRAHGHCEGCGHAAPSKLGTATPTLRRTTPGTYRTVAPTTPERSSPCARHATAESTTLLTAMPTTRPS
jgi:5-methylcytosine-specific restriction protein A